MSLTLISNSRIYTLAAVFCVFFLTGCSGLRGELISAAEQGDVAKVETILRLDPKSGTRLSPYTLNSALLAASVKGQTETVRLLLENGASADSTDPRGVSALTHAAARGYLEIVKTLTEHGAGSRENPNGKFGAPLWDAASAGQSEIVKYLVEHGADMEAGHGKRGGTALVIAASNGHTATVRALLEAGASLDGTDENGTSAHSMATIWHHPDTARVIDEFSNARRRIGGGEVAAAGLSAEQVAQISAQAARAAVQESRPVVPPTKDISSDVDKPNYKKVENEDAYAVVVGVENYAQDLPKADYAERDAKAFQAHLIALGVPARHIQYLVGPRATAGSLAAYLEDWLPKNVTSRSTVYFYFSGHGSPDIKTGGAYLVPFDGNPDFLARTAYPVSRLYETLSKLGAHRVIIALDSCFSGAGGRSVLAKGTRPLVQRVEDSAIPETGGILVLTASAANQISGVLADQGHGAFTYYLLKGLNGGAADGAEHVSLDGLYRYLSPQVQDAAHLDNRDQTPQLLPASARSQAAQIQLR